MEQVELTVPELNARFDHVGIAVSGWDSLHFYRQVLGLSISAPETVRGEAVTAMMVGGTLELLAANDETSVIGRFLRKQGPGLHHIALRVHNLRDAIRQVEDAGYMIVGEQFTGFGDAECIFVHPRSTGGVLVELVERLEPVGDTRS